jgi:hypothetical protein
MRTIPTTLGAIKRHLAIVVVAPLLVVGTLLLLLATGLHGFPLAVVNEDQGFDMPMVGHLNIPESLVKALDSRAFAITTPATAAEARRLYDTGKARVLLRFPAELTQDMMIKVDDPTYVLPNRIELEVAGDNPIERLIVVTTIARTSLSAMAESGGGLSADSLPIPLDVAALVEGFAPAPRYMMTAILGFLAWALTGILSLVALLSMKKQGAEGIPEGPGAVLAFVLAFAVAGWLLYLGLVATVVAILGPTLPAGFMAGSAVLFLLFAAASATSLAVGGRAISAEYSRPLIPFFILPFFLGGFLFPVGLLPAWLQWLPWIFPPFHGLNAAIAVELGRSQPFLPWSIAITGLWALAFTALALLPAGRGKGASK